MGDMRNYFVGVGWFISSLIISAMNDIIAKYSGYRLHAFEVAFFRFLFSSIAVLPFVFFYGKKSIRTERPFLHIVRGVLLFAGIAGWTYGLQVAPVSTGTVISFSIPLFVLVLAVFFLEERVIWQRWVVTIAGFCGIAIALHPTSNDFNPHALIFVMSAMLFAGLDILNKKFVIKETMLGMVFYSSVVTAVVSLPFAIYYWQSPTLFELSLLLGLGIGASLITFLLLQSFARVDATALAHYRYLELLISSVGAYLVFNEVPHVSTLYGSTILIPCTLFIIYSENKSARK